MKRDLKAEKGIHSWKASGGKNEKKTFLSKVFSFWFCDSLIRKAAVNCELWIALEMWLNQLTKRKMKNFYSSKQACQHRTKTLFCILNKPWGRKTSKKDWMGMCCYREECQCHIRLRRFINLNWQLLLPKEDRKCLRLENFEICFKQNYLEYVGP